MRLSGLASGLDIDSMVKELMKAKRTTYDNMIKSRTKVEWQQEDFRTMSTKIVDFRNNKLDSFNLSKAISALKSEVSGDTAAISINSTNSTAAGTLNVKVTGVATAASSVFEFKGGTFTTDPITGEKTEKTLSELGFTETNSEGKLIVKINDVEITAEPTDTLSTLAKSINAKSSSVKATAIYDSKKGFFSVTATRTGETEVVNDKTLNGLSVNLFPVQDLDGKEISVSESAGENAKATINGIEYSQASNRFSVNGFDFTVKAKTADNSMTTITAVKDIDTIVKTIQSFVTEYNSLIGSVNSELSEATNRKYSPLTAEEKKEMSDSEIELWESKARSGTLRGDSTLTKLVTELRSATTALIGGIQSNGQKISIGITTGSYTEKGKLVINEEQLRNALESNPDEVTSLFSDSSTGVFNKMKASTMTALNSLNKKAGTSLTSAELTSSFMESSLISTQIRTMKDRESTMLTRLDKLEAQYFKQFTAMETAINKFNSQSSALSSLSGS